jgi:fructose-bisphosphate aldolase, class II
MMDGSLEEDGKTPADYDYNVEVTAEVVEDGPRQGRQRRRANWAAWVRWNPAKARQEDGHGAVGELPRSTADRSRRGRTVSSPRPASTRWRWRSAPATGPTSSRKPTGEVLAMDRIEEIHAAGCPTATW